MLTPRRNPREETKTISSTQTYPVMIPTQEAFEVDLAGRFRLAVQRTLQVVLDEELERLVGAGPYQRVGRSRTGGAATRPLGRYQRRQEEVDVAITQGYIAGASTRDMGSVTEALLGKRVGLTRAGLGDSSIEDAAASIPASTLRAATPATESALGSHPRWYIVRRDAIGVGK